MALAYYPFGVWRIYSDIHYSIPDTGTLCLLIFVSIAKGLSILLTFFKI